ncbi:HipA N-terminal domain-containing protein [Acinetobacter sp. ANC 4640]
MNNPIDLPSKINTIDVYSGQVELGVLTYGSIHHYQPIQAKQHVSLTMTKKGMDGYSSGSLHPIFSQNLPEGFNRRFIAEKLASDPRQISSRILMAIQ